jgi:hypothetical protein
MRKLLVIFFLIIVVACNDKGKETNSIKINDIHQNDDKNKIKNTNKGNMVNNNFFRVIKLDSIKHFYVIYTKKKNINYKIISEKIELSRGCDKLKVGDHISKLELTSIVGDTSKMSYKVGGVGYQGVEFDFEGDSISDIYEAKNLIGLCLIKK